MTYDPNRLLGGLYGLLVGDALGVPYEFKAASQIPAYALIEMTPPKGCTPTYNVPAGTWSDDGAQALCLLASLLERGFFNQDHFATKLLGWANDGDFAVGGEVFDIGAQSSQVLRQRQPPRDDEHANGNGSLMRTLPLALWHKGHDGQLIRDAQLASAVTHPHVRSRVACALYALWARKILEEHSTPYFAAMGLLDIAFQAGTPEREELYLINGRNPQLTKALPSTGYVAHTLDVVRAIYRWDKGYGQAVREAISLGGDTDTAACVVGGLQGTRKGATNIPARWLSALRGWEILEPLAAGLLARWA